MADTRPRGRLPRGEYVTVSADGVDPGAVYIGVRAADRRLVLHAMLPSEHPRRVGELVQCTSAAGRWTARVLIAGDGVLELQVPRWLNRSAQRRSVRVPSELAVWVQLDGEKVAGRLIDLSPGGGAVLLERGTVVAAGVAVRCCLPPGELPAVVRSVRGHEHPLLSVAGLSWMTLDAACSSWVAAHVASGGNELRGA
jgi:hypothetical protein